MIPEPNCRLCGLCEGRTKIVMPSGDLRSPVVFVGEAPGEKEDFSGKPFVGRSGKLLDAIMEEEGIDRSKVMITNTVKCRPPNNRDPTKEEMDACRPFLDHELSGRKVVIGLGKSACRDLLGYEGKMSEIANTKMSIKVHGKDVLFIPTYHPAACIYSRESRGALRTTMRILKDEYLEE
ncbi:MAG: uracil-DNA glycosylase [Candidatus Methanoplasma sp.]|jgi:DNA polymerase|nr:uracil-DNA glycosylase [Candidatus Methanoplasma sp.]